MAPEKKKLESNTAGILTPYLYSSTTIPPWFEIGTETPHAVNVQRGGGGGFEKGKGEVIADLDKAEGGYAAKPTCARQKSPSTQSQKAKANGTNANARVNCAMGIMRNMLVHKQHNPSRRA